MNYVIDISENSQITYEPKGNVGKGKSCDLLVEADETYLIELKSFHPSNKSAPIPYEHITENNQVIMDGKSYHSFQAVRGHLIDETLDTEKKFKNYSGGHKNILGILLGFYVHLEDLRDFFTIYKKGGYRPDDPLGKMTMHKIGNESFIGNINEFWSFPFHQVGFDFEDGKKAVSLSIIQGKDTELKI